MRALYIYETTPGFNAFLCVRHANQFLRHQYRERCEDGAECEACILEEMPDCPSTDELREQLFGPSEN